MFDSLVLFNPNFMSLKSPHPIWSSAGTNRYEINKAIIQARMLSGPYRTEGLCRFWSTNRSGSCLLPSCSASGVKEDIAHILIHCPSLSGTRSRLEKFFEVYASQNPLIPSIRNFLNSVNPIQKTQFLLDCSILPDVIRLRQEHGQPVLHILFYLTRTWCYSLHRERLPQLGRWNFL